jgi:hypothetical protein
LSKNILPENGKTLRIGNLTIPFKEVARDIGFSEPYFKLYSHPDMEMDYRDYLRIARKKRIPGGPAAILPSP